MCFFSRLCVCVCVFTEAMITLSANDCCSYFFSPLRSSLQYSCYKHLVLALDSKPFLVLICHYEPAVIITVCLSTVLSCTVQREWKGLSQNTASSQERMLRYSVWLRKGADAVGLKVVKEGGRQMAWLKWDQLVKVAGPLWAQTPSAGAMWNKRGKKGSPSRADAKRGWRDAGPCWYMWPGQEIRMWTFGWGWWPAVAEKEVGNKM